MKILIALLALMLCGCEKLNRLLNDSNSSSTDTSISDDWTLLNDYVLAQDNTLANTGIGYDSNRNEMLFAVWDSVRDRNYLLVTDTSLNHLGEIDLTSKIRFIQGVMYERERDLIWVWGTRPNTAFAEWTDCFGLYGLSRNGDVIDSLIVPMLEWYPGMMAYAGHGRMWLKANTKTVARLYDMYLGMAFIKEVDTGIGGEGIAVDTKGNLWVHGACKVKMINPDTLESREMTSPNDWCGEEGMVFDDAGNLWIGSDDGYHFNLEGGNHIWQMRVRSNGQI